MPRANNGDGEKGKIINLDDARKQPRKRKRSERGGPPGGEPPDVDRNHVSQLEALVALVTANADVFADDSGEAHAAIGDNARQEVVRVASTTFRRWLDHLLFERYRSLPSAAMRRDVIRVVEARAVHQATRVRILVRIGEQHGAVYVDLANAAGEVVEITEHGWTVLDRAPVRFRRPGGLRTLPRPVAGGTVDELQQYINVPDDDAFRLVVGWLIAAVSPTGPYPLLDLEGEQGSAKTTTATLLRALVDPVKAPLRALPNGERNLAVMAENTWVLGFDNLSRLSEKMSDALCRVSTGGGLTRRKLFTDADERIFDYQRPVLLTGISELATRPDLADRTLAIELPLVAKRVALCKLLPKFVQAAPRIFGALLNGVSSALRNQLAVHIDDPPRMADFACWVTAAEEGLGWECGSFERAYRKHLRDANRAAFERDPVTALIGRLLALHGGSVWRGTPAALYCELSAIADVHHKRDQDWPKAPNALTRRLRRLAPVLRANGYRVRRDRTDVAREVILEKMPS